jgi:glycogen debranching enzyme
LIDVFENFKSHLHDACVGTVSEIFDADPPHHPRGCVAQAWGVAEMLRIIKEYELVEMNFNAEKKINGADMMQRLAK